MTTKYENHTLVILDGNCDGMGELFAAWVRETYPEIEVDLKMNTSGVGGGLFDEDGNEVSENRWDEYCNS